MLPQEAVNEFKEIYEKRYGVVLTQEEAIDMSQRMFNMYLVLLSPDESDRMTDPLLKGGDFGYDNSSKRVNEHDKRGYGKEL